MTKRLILFALLLSLSGCETVGTIAQNVSIGGPYGGHDFTPHAQALTSAVGETAKAARAISDEEEYYIGRAVAARILSMYPLLENTALTEYLNLVGGTLAAHSDKPYTYSGYHFAVLDTDERNAFACPGGLILITRGMVRTATNEDELAAVVAHEIAHINHRDGIASIKQARWSEALTVIGMKTAAAYSPAEISQLVTIFEGSIDDVVRTLVVNGYSRSQESAADRDALTYLSRAGYRTAALADALRNLSASGAASEGGILKTHPGTEDRISAVAGASGGSVDAAPLAQRSKRFTSALR